MEWMIEPLKRYADFSGRSRRKEYWLFYLATTTITSPLLVFIILHAMGSDTATAPAIGLASILYIVLSLALFLPMLAVSVRRLHDMDKSGWLILLFLIPYVGFLIVLILMAQPGTIGENRFGPDPLREERLAVAG